jgi:hypothetical protein
MRANVNGIAKTSPTAMMVERMSVLSCGVMLLSFLNDLDVSDVLEVQKN